MKDYRSLKLALLAVVMAWSALSASARTYTSETLNYEIVYHWGLIWKHAGNAQLTIKKTGNGYYSQLIGKTRSWADKIYPVRDTLKCYMDNNLRPIKYEKLTHEKKYYARDVVNFKHNGNSTSANCYRYRKGKPTKHVSLSTSGTAYDMVSVFYMLRNLDFTKLSKNKSYRTVVFSGKSKENLTIKYRGVQSIKLRNGSKHNAHKVTFHFTQDGRTKSSDDLTAWLSTDSLRKPLMFVGKLPVGEVKCYLGGSLNK